jgi:hypothetical protein
MQSSRMCKKFFFVVLDKAKILTLKLNVNSPFNCKFFRFLVEEDEEALKKELKNAFEFYDKVIIS